MGLSLAPRARDSSAKCLSCLSQTGYSHLDVAVLLCWATFYHIFVLNLYWFGRKRRRKSSCASSWTTLFWSARLAALKTSLLLVIPASLGSWNMRFLTPQSMGSGKNELKLKYRLSPRTLTIHDLHICTRFEQKSSFSPSTTLFYYDQNIVFYVVSTK